VFIRERIPTLYKLSESVALLDVLVGFAKYSMNNERSTVRPEFTDTMAIHCGRHPVRDVFDKEPVVPNDTFAFAGSSFQIITGPNMVLYQKNFKSNGV
jgi:DNA mismatch repair protein MSH4